MTMQFESPILTYHQNTNTSCTLPVFIMGSTSGYSVQAWKQMEGKDPIPVYTGVSADVGADGRAKLCVEAPFTEDLYAYNYDGDFVGDLVTFIFKEFDETGIETGVSISFDAIAKPGASQQIVIALNAQEIPKQDYTSKNLIDTASGLLAFPSIGASYNLSIAADHMTAGSGPSGGGPGLGCCPCAISGVAGFTPGPDPAAANGGGFVSTIGYSNHSRGLPLIFATTHVANERYKSPWGWYRAMGVYRKLFDQGAAFFRHVTIFREDGTRASYRYDNGSYEPAQGSYDSLIKTDTGWFEKTKIGVYYEYNAHGNLKRVLDPNRNERYYIYDNSTSSQKLIEIKAEKGLRPYFYYEDGFNPTLNTRIALRDPLNEANNKYLYFGYDNQGYMTWLKGAEGCTWYFDYDRLGSTWNYKGKMIKKTDPDGYQTYFGFDGSG